MNQFHPFSRFLSKLALLHPKNHTSSANREYPQTWYLMPKKRNHPRLRCLIQQMCGFLTGHELSKTEWGYGGGKYADRWCRWCDKMIRVPHESLYFQFDNARSLVSLVKKWRR